MPKIKEKFFTETRLRKKEIKKFKKALTMVFGELKKKK